MSRIKNKTVPEFNISSQPVLFTAESGATPSFIEFKNSSNNVVATITTGGNLIVSGSVVANGITLGSGGGAGNGSLYTEVIGNNTGSVFIINHNLGTRDVFVSFRENGDNYENLNVAWEATSEDSITVNFGTPPTTNSVKVLVYGSVSGEITNLNDILDVNAATPSVNQVLSWNGSSWVSETIGGTWNSVGGVQNISFGVSSLSSATGDSYYNIGIGDGSLEQLTSGDDNIAIGRNSLNKAEDASGNIAIGDQTLSKNVSSWNNIAIGDTALFNFIGPFGGNIAIGEQTLRDATTGFFNIAVGSYSQILMTTRTTKRFYWICLTI